MRKIIGLVILVITSSLLLLTGCKKGNGSVELLAAGATFPYPLYQKMFEQYQMETGVAINYQAIGSGGGIKQLLAKTTDFSGTDAFMSDKKMSSVKENILHVPTCLGAVVLSYNLSIGQQLKLTPAVLSGIFLGQITKWNDAKIAAINSGVTLPDLNITVVHRSDSSGTTFIFSDYVTKISTKWETIVGRGKSLDWPVGIGAPKNAGVAGQIKTISGAIGYIELAYATSNNLKYATIQNKSGKFIQPSLQTVSLAANTSMPNDTRVTITNTSSPDGYPIASFTWVIFYQEQNYNGRSLSQAKATLKALWWMIHDGQQYNESLQYGKLPDSVVKKGEAVLKSALYNGKKIL